MGLPGRTRACWAAVLTVIVLIAPTSSALAANTRLCNDGTTALYFATVGEYEGLFQSAAMVQGLVQVSPGRCEYLVPDGMNKVILTFFQKDSRGILTNTRITPTNASKVNNDIRQVCVNLSQPYRLFGSLAGIRSTYVNASCPEGFSPAEPAWLHIPGDSQTDYHIDVHANVAAVPWRDRNGRQYTSASILSVSPLDSAGPLVEANQSSIRDSEAAQALMEAAREYKEESDRRAQERQAQIWAEQQRRRAAHEQRVDQAKASLSKPDDAVCEQYAEPSRFKSGKDIALSGIQLGMSLDRAHEALVCHGFTIDPEVIARAGGVAKYWANAREKTFQTTLADGTRVFTDVEARPPRGAPPGSDFVVITVRIRYQLTERLGESDWQNIRKNFKQKYRAAKRRVENDYVVHMEYKDSFGKRFLQLNADDYHGGTLSRYNISIL